MSRANPPPLPDHTIMVELGTCHVVEVVQYAPRETVVIETPSPDQALAVMIHKHDRFASDW